MANLIPSRINYGCAPFEQVAIDYFGPLKLKYGYRKTTKGYGMIVTCLATRALYIDLATDLSTDAFLLALRRFISVHGQPKQITSDNGSNFIGASREIKELIERWKNKHAIEFSKMKDFLAEHEIKWNFSTPLAPHHNGTAKSMVKSVKISLKKQTRPG